MPLGRAPWSSFLRFHLHTQHSFSARGGASTQHPRRQKCRNFGHLGWLHATGRREPTEGAGALDGTHTRCSRRRRSCGHEPASSETDGRRASYYCVRLFLSCKELVHSASRARPPPFTTAQPSQRPALRAPKHALLRHLLGERRPPRGGAPARRQKARCRLEARAPEHLNPPNRTQNSTVQKPSTAIRCCPQTYLTSPRIGRACSCGCVRPCCAPAAQRHPNGARLLRHRTRPLHGAGLRVPRVHRAGGSALGGGEAGAARLYVVPEEERAHADVRLRALGGRARKPRASAGRRGVG